MNFSSVFGFIAASVVFFVAIFTSTDNTAIFLNEHGIIIVIGGTLAAASISFPIKKVFYLSFVAARKMMFGYSVPYPAIIKYIIELGDKARLDPNFLKNEVNSIKNPFLRDAVQLMNDGLNEEQLREILEQRIDTHSKRAGNEVNMFKALSKFPPAFGLLGTTLGMIGLLQNLGGADAAKKIGPSMAIGLVATMYGIALTNFLLIPIAENLQDKNREDTVMRKIILEGLLMIKNKLHPLIIEEKLNAYLLPAERVKFSGTRGGNNRGMRRAA